MWDWGEVPGGVAFLGVDLDLRVCCLVLDAGFAEGFF